MSGSNSKGNVLFLILIAVALFAALSYAVTSSSRGGGTDVSKEKSRALAAQILQHGIAVRTAVLRMTTNGIEKTTLDAYSPVYVRKNGAAIMDNTACNTDSCLIFNPNGGGVSPMIISDKWALDEAANISSGGASAWLPGRFGLQAVSISGVGSDLKDIVLGTDWITKDFCMAFNDYVGVANPGGAPPVDTVPVTGNHKTNFTSASVFNVEPGIAIGDEAPELIGKDAFCFNDTTENLIVIVIQSR